MKEKLKLKNGNVLYIMHDDSPTNPRTDWDNLGTMVCWHNRYSLGDTLKGNKKWTPPYDDTLDMLCDIAEMNHPDNFNFQNEKVENAYKQLIYEKAHQNAIILPLSLYDHSGLTMWIGNQTSEFDPGGWDSGQIGWIFVTKKKIDEQSWSQEWLDNYHNGDKMKAAKAILEGEVENYDQFLRGEVYGFQMKKLVKYEKKNLETLKVEIIEEEEDVDSCWGFFGDNHQKSGLYDHAGIKPEDILEEETV